MGLSKLDTTLIVLVIVFVILDIILAVCLRFAMPLYVIQTGYYPADGSKLPHAEAAELCHCLYRVFPDGTKDPITMDVVPKKAIYARSVGVDDLISNLERYPYLVSLNIPAYSDDTQEKLFACNGLVQSKEWLLTTQHCVKDESEWYNLTVRSESPFWSKFGKEHVVVDVVRDSYDGLVLLKVSPQFSDNVIPISPIKYPFDGNWTYAVSLGWNDQMYKNNLNSMYKYKPFDIEEWTSGEVDSRSKHVCAKSLDCKVSSKPLLTSCRQLLGIESASKYTCGEFSSITSKSDENTKSYKKNCYSVYEDLHVSDETEVCQI